MGLAMACKKLALLSSSATELFLGCQGVLCFMACLRTGRPAFLQLFREDNFQSIVH